MDTAKVKTPDDFLGPPTSPKRKRHTSIACECCRKLKIRCLGGDSAIGSSSGGAKPCNHCVSQSKSCLWPPEDGRKRARTSSPGRGDLRSKHATRGKDISAGQQAPTPQFPRIDNGESQGYRASSDYGISPTSNPPAVAGSANGNHSTGERSNSATSQTSYTTVHYYRHLGPTVSDSPVVAP